MHEGFLKVVGLNLCSGYIDIKGREHFWEAPKKVELATASVTTVFVKMQGMAT